MTGLRAILEFEPDHLQDPRASKPESVQSHLDLEVEPSVQGKMPAGVAVEIGVGNLTDSLHFPAMDL